MLVEYKIRRKACLSVWWRSIGGSARGELASGAATHTAAAVGVGICMSAADAAASFQPTPSAVAAPPQARSDITCPPKEPKRREVMTIRLPPKAGLLAGAHDF